MFISMSGTPGVQPDDIVGLAAAAVAMVSGIGASAAVQESSKREQQRRLERATRLLNSEYDYVGIQHELRHVSRTMKLQQIQLSEMQDRFRDMRIYSRVFLVAISLFVIIFFWGGVSLILGITAAHLATVLFSAIPGVVSAISKNASNTAVKRSDEAFKVLSKSIEQSEASELRRAAIAEVQTLRTRDTLKILEAIRSISPNATPEELTSIMKELPDLTEETNEE